MELLHRKYAVLAVLDEVYRTTTDPIVRIQVATAALSLREAPEDIKDPNFASAYKEGRILAKRLQNLCLTTSSPQTTGATH